MTHGILTIALKHPLYGRYAYNLALSIKSADPTQRISVIADDVALSHLSPVQQSLFYKVIKPKPEHYMRGGIVKPLVCKFYLNELTPYDETLFVDADMIFSPLCDFGKLWAEMEEVEWTMANRGINDPHKGISEWVDPGMLKAAHGEVEQWYDLSSEWCYFKRTPLADGIFALAGQYYDEGKLHTRQFAGDKPDEPFFNLALNEMNHQPHKAPWQPTYWQPAMRGVLGALEIKRKFYAFSVGGNHLPKQQQRVYDEFLNNASYRMNMQGLPVGQKRALISERKHI